MSTIWLQHRQHLVVTPKQRHQPGRLVPVDRVDTEVGEIRLRCTIAEFGELDPAEVTELVEGEGDGPASAPPPKPATMTSKAGCPLITACRSPHEPLSKRLSRRAKHRCVTAGASVPPMVRLAGCRASCRSGRPPGDPCAASGGAPLGAQGSRHPDESGGRNRRRHPAPHHQAAGGEPAGPALTARPRRSHTDSLITVIIRQRTTGSEPNATADFPAAGSAMPTSQDATGSGGEPHPRPDYVALQVRPVKGDVDTETTAAAGRE